MTTKTKRFVEFLRSVTPEDPWQLLYLTGAVLLFISPRLTWLVGGTGITYGYMVLGLIPVVTAGVFAYYSCFSPGIRTLRRISWAVFLPAVLGFGLIIGEFSLFNKENQSLFAHRTGLASFLREGAITFKAHPTGLCPASVGNGESVHPLR